MEANEEFRGSSLRDLYIRGLTSEEKKGLRLGIDAGKAMDWENEEVACSQMKQLVPCLKDWETAIIWQILNDAKSYPEGMDVEKLHASAQSILVGVTKIYMAAGRIGRKLSSLVMEKMMNMVTEARNESRLVSEKEKEKEQEKPEVTINYMVAAGGVGQNLSPQWV